MLEKLLSWDTDLFNLINHHRSVFGDWVMACFSYSFFIEVVVLLVVLFVLWQKGFKYWYLYVLLFALTVFLADRISVVCFKDVFCRLRPSHALADSVTLKLQKGELISWYKGGRYGFVSSHAANIFSVVTFAYLVLWKNRNKYLKQFVFLALVWVFLTGYSRVYCGFHYPGDVICGSLLGMLVGLFVYWLYLKINTLFKLSLTKTKDNE